MLLGMVQHLHQSGDGVGHHGGGIGFLLHDFELLHLDLRKLEQGGDVVGLVETGLRREGDALHEGAECGGGEDGGVGGCRGFLRHQDGGLLWVVGQGEDILARGLGGALRS
jgi:hypothetical protein